MILTLMLSWLVLNRINPCHADLFWEYICIFYHFSRIMRCRQFKYFIMEDKYNLSYIVNIMTEDTFEIYLQLKLIITQIFLCNTGWVHAIDKEHIIFKPWAPLLSARCDGRHHQGRAPDVIIWLIEPSLLCMMLCIPSYSIHKEICTQ